MNINRKKIKSYQLQEKKNQKLNFVLFSHQNVVSSEWQQIKQLFSKIDNNIQIIVMKNNPSSVFSSISNKQSLQGPIFIVCCDEKTVPTVIKISSQIKSIICFGGYVNSEWLTPLNCKLLSQLNKQVYNPIIRLFFYNFLYIIDKLIDKKKQATI